MKINANFSIFLIIFFIGLISCEASDQTNLTPPFNVTDKEGIVGHYDTDGVESYTIGYAIPNTIDGSVVGFVENLPTEFRTEGLMVVFNGEFKESKDLPLPSLGGQNFYSLSLTSIKLK